MQYPLISEYVRAIQDAQNNLDKLAHLSPVLDDHGEPYRSSGAFAVVFKMKDEQTGKCYALKCFTEEQEGRAEAYRRIADELEYVGSPYVVSVRYLEKELFVDCNCEEEEFPVLLMDWIEGDTMETYIANNYSDSYAMSMLCYRFCKMAAWLRSQPFAHGDIKPDNIIVRSDGTLTLVDYDGMFVPAMKGQKSPTIGTKDFSHPLRTIDDFDETIDDFALATIALSLKAISLDSSLFNRFGASDRLLFSANDYLDLSKSQVLTALQGLLADKDMGTLLSLFLLAYSKKSLSMCSFRAFVVQKPKEEEMLSTEVTEEDLANAVEDEYDVKYSKDWKRLLRAPEELNGEYSIRKGVKVIVNGAFRWCEFLRSIIIPNSVISIGDSAFSGCSLESITIPNSVISIGDSAFSGCSLESITIPNSVTSIGDSAFESCTLRSITISNSVTSIGNSAFYGCISLVSVEIPDSVTSIGDGAFGHCLSLRSIIISNSVTNIGEEAFENCSFLESITIPDSVTSIGDNAFEGCSSLKSIAIPNSVTSIGEGAFENCSLLESITIPDSVTSIGDNAFYGCRSLRSIIIPDSVTSIGDNTFAGCSFESITIPDGVTSIGANAFRGCGFLRSIIIPDSVTSIGDNAFCLCRPLKSIIIPDSVTIIGDGAFTYSSLESITIPNSVTSIVANAFRGCSSLRSIIIPDSVTGIGDRAFKDCSLESIIIPNGVTSIGDSTFSGCCSLTNVEIPDSVTSIGDGAFWRCNNLNPQIKAEIKQRFGKKVFE